MSNAALDPFSSSVAGSFPDSLAEARSGRGQRVGTLLEHCRPYLLAIAEAELSDDLRQKIGASDLVQVTLVRGVEHFAEFRGHTPQELAGWLRRILLNHLMNVERAFETERRDATRERELGAWLADPLQLRPSGEILRREEEARLEAALARLPEHYRQIIQWRHRENKSFAEIGELMQKSDDAVGKLWSRALQRLRRELQG